MPHPPACRHCSKPVTVTDARTACPRCLSWFHGDCWEDGRCEECPAAAPQRARPRELKIRVVNGGRELLIVQRSDVIGGLIAIAVGAPFVWLAGMFALRVDPEGHPLVLAMMIMGSLALGLPLIYTGLVLIVNRLEVHVSKVRIEVRHEPLPWAGAITVPLSDVEQLYVEKLPMKGHGLSVIRRGRTTRLLDHHSLETLRFIEREIEEWLGITDQAVASEAPREAPLPGLPTCPACSLSLDRKARKVACNACFTWHHAACWRNKRCATCRTRREDPATAPRTAAALPAAPAPLPAAPAALPVPDPGGIDVLADDDELVLAFDWKDVRPPGLGLLLLGLSLPLGWAVMFHELPHMPLSTFLALELLLAPVGLWAVYFTVAGWVNRTSIRATPRELAVHHGPLPWRGVTVPVSDVERIVREVFAIRSSGKGMSRKVDEVYELVAVLKDGRRLHLVRFIKDPAHASFLLHELEAHLRAATNVG